MPVDDKLLDSVRPVVIATRAKLDDDTVRREVIDALRLLRGGISKLQTLLNR